VARSDGSDRGGRGAAAWQGGRAGGIQLWAGAGAGRARAVRVTMGALWNVDAELGRRITGARQSWSEVPTFFKFCRKARV